MKKIALLYPVLPVEDQPEYEIMPPLWALSLATYLRAALPGIQVDILDEQVLGRRRFTEAMLHGGYDIAGFSPIFRTYVQTLEHARLLKKKGALVVLGGHHAPALSKEILTNRGPGSDDHCIDAIVQYDGEHALRELAKGTPFSSIKNLVYRLPDGTIAENPVESLKFSDLPPVDYTLLDLEKYFRLQPGHIRRIVPFVAQRGCFWAETSGRCMFCSIQGRGLAAMAPAEVWKQASFLKKKLGIRFLHESCDDFPANEEWLRELAAGAGGIETPVWRIYARATSLNRRNVKLLKAVNVGYAAIGVESFSDAILRRLGKGSSAERNREALSLLTGAGINPKIFLIVGSPGESPDSLKKTFTELKKLNLPAEAWETLYLTPFGVFPGTEAWKALLKKERKYKGLDELEDSRLFRDWVKHFCRVDQAQIKAAQKSIAAFVASKTAALLESRRG